MVVLANHCYKLVAAQIPPDAGLVLIPYIGKNALPPVRIEPATHPVVV